MALRCAEERRLSLDARVGEFPVLTVEPDATLRQLLTHTSGPPDNLSFAYRPERLDPLWRILRACTVDSYRESLANLFKRLAMNDTVPGANILAVVPPAEGVPEPGDLERYTAVLKRRATPYAVDGGGGSTPSFYPEAAGVLTPGGGVVTTVLDLAKFDLALRQGLIVFPETLSEAWTTPASNGVPLPHGTGWFSQQFNGELVVWQFGMTPGASSSLMLKLPARGLTLILMANSDGLVRLYSPENGDIALSPFARLFLNVFTR
jgi:CubicO group peptidase (beta-lactamase class C family)